MKEKQIQQVLIDRYVKGCYHYIALKNIYVYDHESDLITITHDDKVYEFEIKCTKSDFIADFKKEKKHSHFKRLDDLTKIPNWFYYACPAELISVNDIPEYAGLIYIYEYGLKKYAKIIKRAPSLHTEPFDNWKEIAVKLYSRQPN